MQTYTSKKVFFYLDTALYCPPEFYRKGKYYGKPATVWSLGFLLFRMVTGHYPDFLALHMLKLHLWSKAGLSEGMLIICSITIVQFS